MAELIRRGVRAVQFGFVLNALLASTKFVAGVVGHSHALVADAIESAADLVSSLIVWSGLRIAARTADEEYHFGYGKAESIAAAVVSLFLLGAATGIAVTAIREIRTPHQLPAPFTLAVLVGVIVVKELLFRKVNAVGAATGSTAVAADAWHHRSDAITSAAAFVGISVALVGGPGWEAADDWAALLAAGIILVNGGLILRRSVHELMDRAPTREVLQAVADAAYGVEGVCLVEQLRVRRSGLAHFVDIHAQADPAMSLHDAHELSGRIKGAIRLALPSAAGVLVHMEPFEGPAAEAAMAAAAAGAGGRTG